MDASTRDGITWVLGTLISLSVLTGLAVRFVLLPWLRDHLTDPVREVQRQVTENHHKHTPPTLPDRIDEVSTDVKALAQVLEGHLESGDRWLEYVVDALRNLNSRVALNSERIGTMLTRARDGGTQERPAAQAQSPDARAAGLSPPVSPPDDDDRTPPPPRVSRDSPNPPGKDT